MEFAAVITDKGRQSESETNDEYFSCFCSNVKSRVPSKCVTMPDVGTCGTAFTFISGIRRLGDQRDGMSLRFVFVGVGELVQVIRQRVELVTCLHPESWKSDDELFQFAGVKMGSINVAYEVAELAVGI